MNHASYTISIPIHVVKLLKEVVACAAPLKYVGNGPTGGVLLKLRRIGTAYYWVVAATNSFVLVERSCYAGESEGDVHRHFKTLEGLTLSEAFSDISDGQVIPQSLIKAVKKPDKKALTSNNNAVLHLSTKDPLQLTTLDGVFRAKDKYEGAAFPKYEGAINGAWDPVRDAIVIKPALLSLVSKALGLPPEGSIGFTSHGKGRGIGIQKGADYGCSPYSPFDDLHLSQSGYRALIMPVAIPYDEGSYQDRVLP